MIETYILTILDNISFKTDFVELFAPDVLMFLVHLLSGCDNQVHALVESHRYNLTLILYMSNKVGLGGLTRDIADVRRRVFGDVDL